MGVDGIGLPTLMSYLEEAIAEFPDFRSGRNTQYTIRDAALGAFSVFFSQSPSFLAHQRSMLLSRGKSNAGTIFGLTEIPTENHIRSLLDPVDPSRLAPVFEKVFRQLLQNDTVRSRRCFDGTLAVALDGVWFHSSEAVHCKQCNTQQHKDGRTTYYHHAITPTIVTPGSNRVICLQPQFIEPQDGAEKQDCENRAAKRWLTDSGLSYVELGLTILGDDLYCNQPMCELLLEYDYNFVLTCKYTSHKYLKEWIDQADPKVDLNEHVENHWDGKKRTFRRYRFANGVPINGSDNPLVVNWMELVILDAEGTQRARHVFVTNNELTRDNVAAYVEVGRSRWKIENEHNNTLKTKGYNLEHNFGHGEKNLSNLLLSFNLLAFLFHTMLDLFDPRYALIRKTLPRRDRFFNDIKALTQYMLFDSWDALMLFMLEGLDLEDPGG
ncbi:MAG: ISNCY family transposase [Spirochaetales bacterium]